MSSPFSVPLTALAGGPLPADALDGRAVLVVNVASRCGLTPQYEALEALHREFSGRGFTVLGVPCNQFNGQEPGTDEEIAQYCSATWGTTFPMTTKADVNGPDRHPLYDVLTATPDADGEAGEVTWNFEKFLVAPDGNVVGRFRPRTTPDDPALRAAVEAVLPG